MSNERSFWSSAVWREATKSGYDTQNQILRAQMEADQSWEFLAAALGFYTSQGKSEAAYDVLMRMDRIGPMPDRGYAALVASWVLSRLGDVDTAEQIMTRAPAQFASGVPADVAAWEEYVTDCVSLAIVACRDASSSEARTRLANILDRAAYRVGYNECLLLAAKNLTANSSCCGLVIECMEQMWSYVKMLDRFGSSGDPTSLEQIEATISGARKQLAAQPDE